MSTPAPTPTQRIYEAVSNLAYGLKDATVQTVQWGARTCQKGFHHASALTLKVADFIRPYFCAAKKFAVDNPKMMLAGFVCVATGILVDRFFLGKMGKPKGA